MMFERTCSKWWLLTTWPGGQRWPYIFFQLAHVVPRIAMFCGFFGPQSYLRRLFWCHFKSFKTTLTGGVEFPVAL